MAGIASLPEELVKQIMEGDSRCEYAVGSYVIKTNGENGDIHGIGKSGKIVGNLYVEVETGTQEMYLVEFSGDPAPTFIRKEKLMRI